LKLVEEIKAHWELYPKDNYFGRKHTQRSPVQHQLSLLVYLYACGVTALMPTTKGGIAIYNTTWPCSDICWVMYSGLYLSYQLRC